MGYDGYMSQRLPSGYPGDVDLLHFEVKMETDTRIRIKVCANVLDELFCAGCDQGRGAGHYCTSFQQL